MIKESIAKITAGDNLSRSEMEAVFDEIMTGKASEVLIAAFMTAMRIKGETIEEITGAAEVMRRYATRIRTKHKELLDTCGTGGDGAHTFNISTISAFVASGAGAAVAKHGNRSVSSKCGSADLLKEFGVNIEAAPDIVEKCLDEIGIAFLFAPLLHGAMKYATPVRRELGIRTIFNILGPLSNPAGATSQIMGVYDAKLVEPLAYVLKNLGSRHALVVHSRDGLDEISTAAETIITELKNGKIKTYEITPADFGFGKARKDDILGGDAKYNLEIALAVLKGRPGPQRDAVLINAGAAIYAADKAGTIKEGIKLAEKSIDSGMALEKLNKLKELTNKK